MLFLTDKEIEARYKMSEAIKDISNILKDYDSGHIVEANRIVLSLSENSSMLYMPSICTSQKISMIKTVSIFPDNSKLPTTQGSILVTHLNNGKHIATLEASYLTRLRTGAMTALATRKLAREDAKTLGIIGTGNMALEQILGVLEVRDIETIYLFNRTKEKAERFKKHMREYGISLNIKVVDNVKELVQNSDIINCQTQSKSPVFNGKDLQKGTHINGVGSFKPEMIEMDLTTIKRANKIYLDDFNGAKEEAGEIINAVNENVITWDDIDGTLIDINKSTAPLRHNNDDITLYKCVGAGYFDLGVVCGVMHELGEL